MMLTGSFPGQANPPPPVIGIMFVVIGLTSILIGMAFALCMIFTGLRLRQRRSRTFCIVTSALACTAFPFGTALGIWTLLLLSRPASIQTFNS